MEIISYRVMDGPNIYSYTPVIEIVLDLGNYDKIESKEINGFNKCLLKHYSGLYNHTCSFGEKGGFVQRLKEGTYFGHITEHLCLEIQNLHGDDVYYGKTRWLHDTKYKIVVEYIVEEVALFAFKSALEIVENICNGNEIGFIIERINKELEKIISKHGIGPSTSAILESAAKRDVPVIPIDKDSCLYQLGYGKKQKRIAATITSATSCVAVDIASNKLQTNNILKDAGLPVPRGFIVEKAVELKELISRLGSPLVVKPYNCNHGNGVSLYINNWHDLKNAFYQAKKHSDKVIIEEYIKGNDYRLLLVDNQLVAAAERTPPHVIGDGKNTIKKLIDNINNYSYRGEGHEKPLTRIYIDEIVSKYLSEQGYTINTIPDRGQVVYLRYNGNLSTGGTARDITAQVHPSNAELAVRAARVIGLDIAGIDIIAKDIRVPLLQQDGAIIEVNAAPGIRMHHHPLIGESRNVADEIIKYLFPNDNGRIPVISITGTNGKTTTTRILARIFKNEYDNVGFTTTDGTYVNNHCIISGDNTGPISARTLLKDPLIDIALLETARGGILREGLGYQESDIGVIINISEDHLGVHGIETIEDLADVKSLIIETVRKTGRCILNADDKTVFKLADRASAPVIFFSQKSNNANIYNHCNNGGEAVYIEGNNIIYQKEKFKETIFKDIRRIPIAFNGIAKHNIENVLAAASVAISLGINNKYIIKELMSFGNDCSDNIGRLNVFQSIGLKVILDYGHNPAGFEEVLTFMENLQYERLIGVVGVPGDRSDQLIVKAGETVAKYLDVVYLKEDQDLRGREPGEVSSLISKGLKNCHFSGQYSYIAKESEALETALHKARPGDVIVCFYEKNPDELIRIIKQGLMEYETKEPHLEEKKEKVCLID